MKVIALQGIRGGVGTTAIVAGLAQAAHEQGARVLAVDLCPDNQLGIHLGLPHDDPGGWSRLTQPAREWRGALHRREEGLDLLSHGGGRGRRPSGWRGSMAMIWCCWICPGAWPPSSPAGACWWSMRMPTAMCGFTATSGRPMSVCW
ncbi:cellulose synthase operon protein YhjQ/BcsQ [Aeromonas caviae]|uniref:cellulose synthase operon protein YhjQ/BcsQ n=1 Tax=Aeromonas caviae TaxID=648 RepID=UPI0021C4242F|nr:cellulose synthase operon protein YhjQ/BcsQ [Aeromonas caviae]